MEDYRDICRRQACKTFKSFMKVQNSMAKTTNGNGESKESVECPLDKESLGRAGWSLLHTIAAYYPDEPSKEERHNTLNFIHLFSKIYPCPECAEDIQENIKKDPPKVESHHSFSLWMCDLHNKVNNKLGKPIFDCSKVDERWLYGPPDGSCG